MYVTPLRTPKRWEPVNSIYPTKKAKGKGKRGKEIKARPLHIITKRSQKKRTRQTSQQNKRYNGRAIIIVNAVTPKPGGGEKGGEKKREERVTVGDRHTVEKKLYDYPKIVPAGIEYYTLSREERKEGKITIVLLL